MQTTAGTPGLPLGTTFLMLGDEFRCAERGIQWTGQRSGRRNWVVERRRTSRDWIPVDAAAR